MDPSQFQQPANYLDQIAPKQVKRPLFTFSLRNIILLGIGVIVLIVIMVNISSAISNAKLEPWQRLSARLDATEEVATTSKPLIKDSKLKSANSELKIYLTNTKRDLAAPFKSLKITTASTPKKIITSESSTEIDARLEDGRLKAKYDSTYAREMSFQLTKLLTILAQTYNTSSSQATKSSIKKAYESLKPIQKNIADYSAVNE